MECSHRTFWLPGCLQMPLPFSLETKSPPDNRSGLWTAFFPSQLRADSYLPHHPEQDFTGNTDPSNKSKRAVMIFFLNFSLYNKEAPKDKLNLISGLSNLDTTKKKKKGGGETSGSPENTDLWISSCWVSPVVFASVYPSGTSSTVNGKLNCAL